MPTDTANQLIARRKAFQEALLSWYRANARVLPWRQKPALYKTVVSELMLQQTQIKTALPYFHRWMTELPDFAALAAASESKVLKLWEGLGYYSRARNLHKLAKAVAALPTPPRTPEAWQELPGVGPYTAAAITSISFGAPAACVDGNVVRILARLTANATEFRDSASAAKEFAPLAKELLSIDSPGDHNQAMMELGATVCFRQSPACTVCPVIDFCAAARSGAPEQFPRLAQKKIETVSVSRIWLQRDDKVLLHQAAATARRFAGMYEIPSLQDLALEGSDLTAKNSQKLTEQKRSITRYRITEIIFALTPNAALIKRLTAKIQNSSGGLQWIAIADLPHVTFSGPHRRLIEVLL